MKIDGRTLDHKTLEHLRITACKRVLEDGELPSAVAASLGFCRTSIYPWLRRIEKEGWEALAEKIAEGPDCRLTEKERQRVKRWIVGKDPRQYGFEFGLWTRRIVQTMIREKFGIELCLTSVGKLLAQLELTPQKPLRRAYERDPVRIELWKAEEFPKLKKRARKHGAKIYFLDETGFTSEPNLRRTYGLKGETPVVKTSAPGFVVSGKGNPESLNSASHGAGRLMSRTQASKTFEWKKVNAFLREKGVTLISAGLDEVPMVYKNIHEVMAAQKDLVTILGQFDPKLVKMAPHGERAED